VFRSVFKKIDLGDVDNLFVSLDISTFSEAYSKIDLLVIGEVLILQVLKLSEFQ